MSVKTEFQLELMRKACKITAGTLKMIEPFIKPGVATIDLDKIIEKYIIDCGATPSFKGYNGFPNSACISVNEMVVHGIPSSKIILKEGDIVSIDVGAKYKGYNGDAARTFAVGKISADKEKLIRVTKECFFEGIKNLKTGVRVGEISNAVQTHAEKNGFSVVRELVGHGVGKKLHEDPQIPNFGEKNEGPIIGKNKCLAIEPMINAGGPAVVILADGWSIVAKDRKPSAHYENTVLVTENGAEILTEVCDE